LGNYDHRILVANSLAYIIKENNIDFDYIAGIPTAGIAPAASLSQVMNKPLIIYDNNELIKSLTLNELERVHNSKIEINENDFFDVIGSTCPYAIPLGVNIANHLKKPFVYIRQNEKDHGLKKKIEGILLENQTVLLFDYFLNLQEAYGNSAIDSIFEVTKKTVSLNSDLILKEKVDVSGKKLLVLEDLISTGSSSIKEINKYRKEGAIVDNLLSIFNYGIPEIAKNYEDAKINVFSALYYDTLLKVAKEKNYITSEDQNLLAEWRAEPFKWGDKNGFPFEDPNKKIN
ncbi:MAG: hypothetical protein PHN56_05345, partial [Candidatus Nanoarchaeia archaeon]|nr:hypothetical protein [Candidatus Nanoarchaeia archaeon]